MNLEVDTSQLRSYPTPTPPPPLRGEEAAGLEEGAEKGRIEPLITWAPSGVVAMVVAMVFSFSNVLLMVSLPSVRRTGTRHQTWAEAQNGRLLVRRVM